MTESEDDQSSLRKTVLSLRDKANLQASCHSCLADRYGKLNIIAYSVILLFSTLAVTITFISDDFLYRTIGWSPDAYRWFSGFLSFGTFTSGLLLAQWDWSGKQARHQDAVRHYFLILDRCRHLLDMGSPMTRVSVDDLRGQYEATQMLPKIPDSSFLRLKQSHLRKMALSREMDENPFESIRSMERRLAAREPRGTVAPR